MARKILILGDGILGTEIKKQTNWDIISRKKNNFDIRNYKKYSKFLKKYDVILNCIANTDTYSDERDGHWDVNFKYVEKLINYCNKNNKKLIHISTDYIYANSKQNASEEDVPCHIPTWYGYTKLLGDALVQLKSKKYLICRLSHKPKPFPYENAWIDVLTNCDYVDIIAKLVILLIEKNANGVYNVGTENKTIYELAMKTKNVHPINSPIITPKNTTMNINKINKWN
jgi:dTDP-4-dehydrorhamnose reductase